MKKTAVFLSLVISVIYLTGCDKIEGDHFQPTAPTDTAYIFPADTTPDVYRVLLEEYTGHTCGNCPAAAAIIYNTLVPAYGDDLVVIGVHANFFAEPCPPHSRPPGSPLGAYSDDFRTQTGEDWYTLFQIYSNPLGMINRIGYPNNQIITSTDWNTEIAGIINNAPQVKIRIHNIYNPSTRQLQTFSETKFLTQLNGKYNINVVLTEDSIVTWQLNDAASSPNDSVFVERHVLRGFYQKPQDAPLFGSINGSFGIPINASSAINTATKYTYGYSVTLPSEWNASHVHVVVFVYDAATYQILNVVEDPVIE
jgi:hypothetical protein